MSNACTLPLAFVAALWLTPHASAYVVYAGYCLQIPISCPPPPYWNNPDCEYEDLCNRSEGAPQISDPGTPASIVSAGTLRCDTCCPDCGSACPPTMVHLCTTSLSISTSRSFTFTWAPGLTAAVKEVLEVEMKLSFGWSGSTTYSNQVTVGSEQFPSCKIGFYRAQLDVYTDAVFRVFSSFYWTTAHVSGDIPPCIGGTTMNDPPCSLGYFTTCTSARWGDAVAQWLGNQDCP